MNIKPLTPGRRDREGGNMKGSIRVKPPPRTNRIREHPGDDDSDEVSTGPPRPRHLAPSLWRDLQNLGIKVAAISVVFVLVFSLLYGLHRNTDPDMFPRVIDGDLVMFYRLDKDYAIGDLVVLDFEGERQVRRVVARAGDTVDITAEGLVVNGSVQIEPAIYEDTLRYSDGVSLPLTLAPGQVFVLGDARANATDSRIYGPVDSKDTLGTVITVIRRRHL